MHLLTFLVIIETILAYEWPEFNDKFDCIVGIVVDNTPVSVGVFISTRTVLTSANPFNHIEDFTDRLLIHSVNGYFNVSKTMKVVKVADNQSYRNDYWKAMGAIKGKLAVTSILSIHDIALLTISEYDKIWKMPKNMTGKIKKQYKQIDKGRKPYPVKLPNVTSYVQPTEWVFAGFGYLDQDHVQNNTILEMSYSSESLTDCDEWIPREWGRFICIIDNQDLYSLASGAPLFEDGDMDTVYGIGCYMIKKGKENLLVFTDLRPYVNKLVGYDEDFD